MLSVLVPDAVGLPADAARGRIESSGFEVVFSPPVDSPRDFTVVSQQPPAGETAVPNSPVRLEVSRGSGAVLPDPDPTTDRGLTFRIARLVCD